MTTRPERKSPATVMRGRPPPSVRLSRIPATSGKISNTNNIQFGPALADWPQAVAFGVLNAQSNGNLLYWDVLPTPKTIQQGDFGQFAPGSLVVEED